MTTLLIDAGPVGFRLGLTDADGRVVRLHHEFPGRAEARLGALYRAKVHANEPRLGGIFCRLDERGTQGFLAVKGRPPRVGDTPLVSVRREAIGDKAAQLVADPALRLPGATVRQRDGAMTVGPGPLGEGDAARALALAERTYAEGPVGPVEAGPPLLRAVMPWLDPGIEGVRVTEPDAAAVLRGCLEPLGLDVALYDAGAVRAPLDAAEDEALARVTALPGGGRMVVDEAEALTAIDVDTTGRDARSVKGAQEAVAAALLSVLGRQAALRGIGGQIVLDLPRRAFASPKVLRDRLTKALAPIGRVSVPAVTNEGVVVVIAPRAAPSLLERLCELDGAGVRPGLRLRSDVVAARACRALEAALTADRSARVTLACPGRARRYVDEAAPALADRYGARFAVETREGPPHVR